MTDTTWDPAVGDVVVTWQGYDEDTPGRKMTIERLTATLIITSGGRRWKRDSLMPVGATTFRTPRLYRADDPRIADAARRRQEKAERSRAARDLAVAAGWWVDHHTDEAWVAALRAAIIAVAPRLGLTVTDPATLCQYGVFGDPGERCLLPADHADSGQWHTGLDWTASLGATTEEG